MIGPGFAEAVGAMFFKWLLFIVLAAVGIGLLIGWLAFA